MTANNSEISIPVSDEISRFHKHLSIEQNKRILFSAGFGAGKTYFLDRFFSEKKKDFQYLNLYPVDYSVTTNDDIFEIIKFDLLDALLAKFSAEISLNEEDISQSLITQEFLRNEADYYKIFKVFAKHFVPKGEALTDLADVFRESFDARRKFGKEMSETAADKAQKFLALFRSRPNTVRELDATTLLIREFLSRIKKADDRPLVLVIDDLDRLDPEHIFRVFNVFTAHHDSRTEQNKFGFDKVIFVCDVNNIEHMFHHRFGARAEFSGYIDKFYSTEIFHFQHKSFLQGLFYDSFIKDKTLLELELDVRYPSDIANSLRPGTLLDKIFRKFVHDLIGTGAVKIRGLLKFSALIPPVYGFQFNGMKYPAYYFNFLTLVSLLRQLFPRLEDLQYALDELSGKYASDYSAGENTFADEGFAQTVIEFSLPFLDMHRFFKRNLKSHDDGFYIKNEHGAMFKLQFQFRESYEHGIGTLSFVSLTNKEPTSSANHGIIYKPNPYWIFKETLKTCIDEGLVF